jgi:hypothetical protein
VPLAGFLACVVIRWEPIGANVDAEDDEVLRQLTAHESAPITR